MGITTTDIINGGFSEAFQNGVKSINSFLEQVLFFKVMGFPFLILLAIICFIVCNVMFNFVSIRLFKHSIDVVKGKYTSMQDPGNITHSQAIFTAALSTVGLGSVAGVAIAVSIGGPGAVFWLFIAGFLGMATKFGEIAMGHKYRTINQEGISGGPFLYMKKGMTDIGLPKLGVFLGACYAFAMIITSFGAPNMFQTNQTALVLSQQFSFLAEHNIIITMIILIPIAIVVLGDAQGIARLAGTVVPFMTVFYIVASIIVLLFNYKNLGSAIVLIVKDAFNPAAASAGIVGSMVAGFSRAVFATESGGGTAAIAHAPSKTKEHIREGCTAFIEVLLALSVCTMTGLVIVVTNSYLQKTSCVGGIAITNNAFKTVHPYFSIVLSVAVYFLAVTTAMGWSYFGTMSWLYLFKKRGLFIYRAAFLLFSWYGIVAGEAREIIVLCDIVWNIAMLPNLFALLFMGPMIRRELNDYIDRYKKGAFKAIK